MREPSQTAGPQLLPLCSVSQMQSPSVSHMASSWVTSWPCWRLGLGFLLWSESPGLNLSFTLTQKSKKTVASSSRISSQNNILNVRDLVLCISLIYFLSFLQKLQRIDTPHCHSALPCKCPMHKRRPLLSDFRFPPAAGKQMMSNSRGNIACIRAENTIVFFTLRADPHTLERKASSTFSKELPTSSATCICVFMHLYFYMWLAFGNDTKLKAFLRTRLLKYKPRGAGMAFSGKE